MLCSKLSTLLAGCGNMAGSKRLSGDSQQGMREDWQLLVLVGLQRTPWTKVRCVFRASKLLAGCGRASTCTELCSVLPSCSCLTQPAERSCSCR